MISTLLINHIKIGEFDTDDYKGILSPNFKTLIEGEDFTVEMEEYHFGSKYPSLYVRYLLSEMDKNGLWENTLFEFDSEKDIDIENKYEFYQLNEISNTKEE